MLAPFFKPEIGGGLRGRASRPEPERVQLGAAALLQPAIVDGSFAGHWLSALLSNRGAVEQS